MQILHITALLLSITSAFGAQEGPNPNAPKGDSSDEHDKGGLPKMFPKGVRMIIQEYATPMYRKENIQYFNKRKEKGGYGFPIYSTGFDGASRRVPGYDGAVDGMIREAMLQADAAFGSGGEIYYITIHEPYRGCLYFQLGMQHTDDEGKKHIKHYTSGLKTYVGWANYNPTEADTTVYKEDKGHAAYGTRKHYGFDKLSKEEMKAKFDALRKIEIPQEKAREAERQRVLKAAELRRMAKRKWILEEQRRVMEEQEQKMQDRPDGIVSEEWKAWKQKLLATGVPEDKIPAVP